MLDDPKFSYFPSKHARDSYGGTLNNTKQLSPDFGEKCHKVWIVTEVPEGFGIVVGGLLHVKYELSYMGE